MAGSTTLIDHSGPSSVNGTHKTAGFGSERGPEGWEMKSSGGGGGAGGGKRTMPHIDDIKSVTVDVDPNASLEKVLEQAEICFRQATSAKTFGRLDLALKDYIRATIILLDIDKNKGWPSWQQQRNKAQSDKYQKLMRDLKGAHTDFERIKEEIVADNARTGVRPLSQQSSLNGPPEKDVSYRDSINTVVNGGTATNRILNSPPERPAPSPPKVKPIVHPKPQNLHGKALRPAGSVAPSNGTAQDLAQRFANLRTSTANRIQDPRIRTQPPIIPLPTPPLEEPPKPPPTTLPFTDVFAEMPRVPAAIYNPVRGTVSSEAAELPSSAPRTMFTRTNSMTSPNPNKYSKTPMPDVSGLTQTSSSRPAKRQKLKIPPGNTITVDELHKYMQAGTKEVSILLIDIRRRAEFDAGHILSQATICVEAEVLNRDNISALQIQESMVLAPEAERVMFENRHEFDLIVFYDQTSTQIPSPFKLSTQEEKAILGLYDALTRYDFSRASSGLPPKLLDGGLDAWTDIFGTASLQTSSTGTSGSTSRRQPMAQALLQRPMIHTVRSIQDPEEARKWRDRIADATALSPVRTTEEFLRRFPAISPVQESMTSPVSPENSRPSSPIAGRLSEEQSILAAFPEVPARPPPAVPRRSYSGLLDTSSTTSAVTKTKALRQYRTGIQNPGNWCYANSSLQAMFGTPGFARELWSHEWVQLYKVPRKPEETIENPQLLTRSLASLFHWLNQGSMKDLQSKTLMVCFMISIDDVFVPLCFPRPFLY